MQAIRQSLAICLQRQSILARPSLAVAQQLRFDGSDPRSSTSAGNHKQGSKQSDPGRGSDLNKSKGGEKKKKTPAVDDTKQPGTTRKDWNQPDKMVGNDPQYGKGTSATDARKPDAGKK